MSLTLPLYRLQQIDTRLKQINSRLSVIQATLENNSELKAAAIRLEEARSASHRAQVSLKSAEYESANQRIKLELADASLYSGRIHNPKELQDLQKDIASIKRNLNTLEDQQLEFMISVETALMEVEKAQQAFDITQGKVIGENASLNAELLSLQKDQESFNAQRLAVLPAIDPSSLVLYDSLRQKRSGLAVSMVSENACNTCGASLTPGLAQSVRNSNSLVFCPMCGRILYSN